MNPSVESYAMKILADHGCDCYTYGGEQSEKLMDDLKDEYPNGMDFPYIDVANAILSMSRPRPIYRAPWKMAWENEHSCDATDHESFESAKADAEDTLVNWAAEQMSEWKEDRPTEEERMEFNYMICNCSVSVLKYVPETDEYETVWEPSYDEEKELGWVEIEGGPEDGQRHGV